MDKFVWIVIKLKVDIKKKSREKKMMKNIEIIKYITNPEDLARSVLGVGEWNSYIGSIPVKTIAEYFDFRVYVEDDMPNSVDGHIYVGGTTRKVYGHDKVIVVRKDKKFAYQRFVIAYELGRYLMDYVGSELEKNPKKLFMHAYVNEDVFRDDAYRFAIELLMPVGEFATEYIKVMRLLDFDERFAIPTLAIYFGVQEKFVLERLRLLC